MAVDLGVDPVPAFRFDGKNLAAQVKAAKYAADRVVQISNETRQTLRTLIEAAIRDGIPPYDAARAIRPMIGLTSAQAGAAMKYRANLIDMGHAPAKVDSLMAKYVKQRIAARAVTIARTEVMQALNTGMELSWQQAQQQGHLGKNVGKEWIVTPDEKLCPVCAPMDGKHALVGKPFAIPGPPAHPRCRCTTGLAPDAFPKSAPVQARTQTNPGPGTKQGPRDLVGPRAPNKVAKDAALARLRDENARKQGYFNADHKRAVAMQKKILAAEKAAQRAAQMAAQAQAQVAALQAQASAPAATLGPGGRPILGGDARIGNVMRNADLSGAKQLGGSTSDVFRKEITDPATGEKFLIYIKPKASQNQYLYQGAGGTDVDRELFGYKIDRLLGNDLVPVTVESVFTDGRRASIQYDAGGDVFAYAGGTRQRKAPREDFIGMTMLDGIIGNTDRHQGNAHLRDAIGGGVRLRAIDQGRTFQVKEPRMGQERQFKVKNWRQEVVPEFWKDERVYPAINTTLTAAERKEWLAKLDNPELKAAINDASWLTDKAKSDALFRIAELRTLVATNNLGSLFAGNIW